MSEHDIIAPSLAEAAERFWQELGARDPDELPRLLPLALPLTTQLVPTLSLRGVEAWYRARGHVCTIPCHDRRLHGCLVAERGAGTIFLDAGDAPDERRFTLAHEIAHFLLDYLEPRRRACERFGPGILQVLDGLRPPTLEERLDAILGAVPLGVHVHLLEGEPGASRALIWPAENRADALGIELLAPAGSVCAALRRAGATSSYFGCASAAHDLLRAHYGLPETVAAPYSRRIAAALTGGPSVMSSLGFE